MDDFGIGAAVRGCFRSVTDAMRATGRTTRLIERYQDGDRVVFHNSQEAKRVERLARERGKDLSWSVVNPRDPRDIFNHPSSKGRTHFDHSWLEMFYSHRIQQMTDEVRDLQDQSSGFGEPHRETREAAQMISKFRV